MIKVICTATFLFLILTTIVSAQETPNTYTKYWQTVHKYELQELPQSAAAVVDTVYTLAKKENNQPQLVKALIYQSKFMLVLEEDAQLKVVNQFEEEIAANTFPVKNILENLLANLYWQYFNENRWKFYNRTHTQDKVNSIDFRTWDPKTLFGEIHLHFKNSLQDASLAQQTDLNDFNKILIQQEGSKIYRPTLFDFLAHNALEFYRTTETSITQPAHKFTINDSLYFENFEVLEQEMDDSLSIQYQALHLYRDLMLFHEQDEHPTAFVTIALERLAYLKANATLEEVDRHYEKALLNLKNAYQSHTISTAIDFEMASFYSQQADAYQPKTNEEHQFKKKEALELCKQAIARFPESLGAQNCAALQQQILSKSLEIRAEKYLSIGQPSRLLLSHKNIDSLYFKIYPVSEADQERFRKSENDSSITAFFSSLYPEEAWQVILRNENDYQNHGTEVVVPALPQGSYLVIASLTEQSPQQPNQFGYSFLQVTNLAFIENGQRDKYYRFQVVDRNTGAPVAGAKVQFKNKYKREDEKKFNQSFTTDKNGLVQFKVNDYYRSLEATVITNNDEAIFSNYYLYAIEAPENSEKELVYVIPFLFTDRSIYRPAQTVYFKGILIKKQGEKSELVMNEYVEVYLEDVNGQEIKTLRLKTNEFGSFSGEFILPVGGITGEYTLRVEEDYEEDSKLYDEIMEDFEWVDHMILVEEYKRPKFETTFKPVTANYQVNDTVTVNGKAIAFAGANITDAKVTYQVQRKVQYAPWYYWSRPYSGYNSASQEITHGETTTDAQGEFHIQFKAIPDLNISKEDLPVFNYEITADVTDINGETRSATTIVKVGYHSLLATLQVPDIINKVAKENKISITTQNLNGEFVTAKGTVKIYKLQAPEHVLRDRPWEAPDYQEFSNSEFKALFPHDPYENEDNPENWEKGKPVLEFAFDTNISKEIVLEGIENWVSGNYFVELESQDDFGHPVMDKQKFRLYSPNDKKLADQALFSITTDKASYRTGENVKLKIGSASEDLTVTIDIEKNHQVVSTQLVHLENNVKTLEVPVTSKDIGGFAIRYSFVNFNAFKSGVQVIPVIDDTQAIEIETVSFRDKLQPGENQTWSFKIKGNNSDRVVAEMLAGMYDASLDQFKPHNWHFDPTSRQTYYSYNSSDAYESFTTIQFTVRNLFREYNRYYNYNQTQYDKLDWFGFSFANNRYINQQYLERIAATTNFSRINSSQDKNREKGFIYGTITDEQGEPIPGANILLKGTDTGTVSDIDGEYAIKAKKGDELIFNFIGYQTVSAVVGERNIIDVRLVADVQQLREVVVAGYGEAEKQSLTGAVAGVTVQEVPNEEVFANLVVFETVNEENIVIRGNSSIAGKGHSLYVVDGVVVEQFELDKENIVSMEVLKGDVATSLYGAKAANGVVIITTKVGQKKLDAELALVNARKNLQETAFFFPHVTTDKAGRISFNFTAPEALTRWKLQLLAHTKALHTTTKTLYAVTQKNLMVIPNPPRFLRQDDEIVFSSKIANLTADTLTGFAALQLFDAITGNPVDEKLGNLRKNKPFTIDGKGNIQVSWSLTIPDELQALQYKIVAKAGDFSDGEQNILPVFSNRILVTETLPMWVRANETQTFTLNKLKNTTSASLQHHQLTLEMTSNPAWYAVQALPYLMEFPYECAEQTFARYYANTLASHIVNTNPKVKAVFDQWAAMGTLISSLEKNEELKSIIIQETPWLRDAERESEQKKRMALLFDLNKMNSELENNLNKLKEMQLDNGGFPWFKGNPSPSRYITQHIATGFGHLIHLNAVDEKKVAALLDQSVKYLDSKIIDDYKQLLKQATEIRELARDKQEGLKKEKEFLKENHLSPIQIHYLYMRSFFADLPVDQDLQTAIDYYRNQSATYWQQQLLYMKGMIALIQYRKENKEIPQAILKSLLETSITNEEMGRFWKENKSGWQWNEAPVETQALLIEVFSEITMDDLSAEAQSKTVDELKVWLLKNKQTNQWTSTKATTEAVYALLLQGSDWISVTNMVDIQIGNQPIDPTKLENVKLEAGTGYFKTSWNSKEITPEMSEVKITKPGKGIAWGALYWQYFEDLDKITATETTLQLRKKLFLKKNTDTGEELIAIHKSTEVHLGDLIRVRIELKVDREMDFVHMKDMHASGLEPVHVLSAYKWQDGLGYYESTRDASTNFFFDHLPKGIYVFEYDLRVNHKGDFSNGITTIQSMYAPELNSHSEGVRVIVD